MNKKKIIQFCIFFVIGIFLINLVYAQVSYCCEKTKINAEGTGGMWCQNEEQENCDPEFDAQPASCEATSYCKKGCCYNPAEGTCSRNTAKKECNEDGGTWTDSADCDIPQCELGCCLIGEQASFVTQTRCKRMSSLYGLNISFRIDISTEMLCIASARSSVKGACVFEQEFERTCRIETQKECFNREGEVEFYEGNLCSNPTLATNCGYPGETICVEGKDAVYFTDTCGNIANIYDSSKLNNAEYWSYMKDPIESCDYGENNANSADCGNCDYYLGSTCKAYDREKDETEPDYGNYICRDLDCKQGALAEKFFDMNNRYPQHGETWCDSTGGTSKIIAGKEKEIDSNKENLPGSRYFRLACYNGEITIEPCAEFRQEVCIESSINGFSTAACKVNRWEDCVTQEDKDDCENTDKRDCQWFQSWGGKFVCIPKYAPGFDFWESEEDAQDMCNIGSSICVIEYEKSLGGKWKRVDRNECSYAWVESANKLCTSLGDCGISVNYYDVPGYYDLSDLTTITGRVGGKRVDEVVATLQTQE